MLLFVIPLLFCCYGNHHCTMTVWNIIFKPRQPRWAGFIAMLMCVCVSVCVCLSVCLLTIYLKNYLSNQLHFWWEPSV